MPRFLTASDLVKMIDFSAVAGGLGDSDVEFIAKHAKERRFVCAMVMPCYVKKLAGLLAGETDILLATVVGFPSGANTTEAKLFETRLAVEQGCREIDMVINVGALKSGRDGFVEDEIRAVVETAAGNAVKVILETHYLTAGEIRRGCELCIEAGAHFVKTSTGWAPTGATLENVALIKSFVGDKIKIKASGGIRTLSTLVEMHRRGATRFGIGAQSALHILAECEALPGARVEI